MNKMAIHYTHVIFRSRNTFPFISTFRQTDDIRKIINIFFVEQGIVQGIRDSVKHFRWVYRHVYIDKQHMIDFIVYIDYRKHDLVVLNTFLLTVI